MAEATRQASSFEVILAQSRDLVCARLGEALHAMLDKADEGLASAAGESRNRDTQALYQEARKVLAGGRKTLEQAFQKYYLQEFRFRASSAGDPSAPFAQLQMSSSLQLVGEDDLEETLKFKDLATKLRRFCDEELAALDQRVGVLLGDATLKEDDNPFSPQAICDAYQQACHDLDTTLKVRGVLMKLFDDHVVDEIRSIYKAVNALLVKHSILPKIRYGVSKADEGKPAAAEKAPAAKAPAVAAEAAASEANIFAMLQSLVGSGGGGAGALPGQPVLQGAELLGSLTQIQRGDAGAVAGGLPAAVTATIAAGGTTNVLHELKASSVGAGMAQMDAMTLDIVAMLFDQLFDDPKIPIGLKGLIGRLQIPMLKVAIADKAFFSKKTHPARRVLDTFGEISIGLPADFNAASPIFEKLDGVVQNLLDGFQDDVAIFEAAERQLRAIIAQEDERVEAESRAVAEKAAQAESLSVAKTAAEEEIRSRVQANALPGPVLEFLVEHWLKLLLLLHVKAGAEGTGWKNALYVMDQLIWSVQPKDSAEERRKLAATVPAVVQGVTAGMKALNVSEEARAAFFAALMKVHTEILSGASKSKAAEEAAPAPAALDFTAPLKVKNPYGAGEVQVSGVELGQGGARAIDADTLEKGMWIELRPANEADKRRAAKVLFITPKRTRFVFSDRNGNNMEEMTRAELVRRLKSGELVRLDQEPEPPLFERIMNGLVGKLRAKPPAARPVPAVA